MRLALVLCLAALCGSAAAGRPDLFDASGDAGRGLLQSGSDCSSINYCSTCRFQFVRGTVTRAVCTACTAGYVPKALGSACWCAPGYYWDGAACKECGDAYFCPGSKSTPTSAAHTSCGSNKNTTTTLAKSERECLANPGYGWASGSATPCDAGTYNPGYNNRKCSRCPGGLTTSLGQATDPSACEAPAGFYYLRGKAVACAQGSYKISIANADCTECNEGITTEPGKTAKTLLADCKYLKAGYSIGDTYLAGTTNGTLCEADTYRTGEAIIASGTPIPCTGCLNNLRTPPEVTGATSIDECMAPPGYGFYDDNGVPKASECGADKYKAGYNREECTACPTGFTTGDVTNATSIDDCYVPPGYGTAFDGTTWSADKCPANSYGRDAPSYGLVNVPCTTCIEGTNTDGKDTQTTPDACVLNAGWGYYNGEARLCDVGFYNAGNNTSPCTACVTGRTTLTTGKTTIADCLVAPGYYGNSTYVKPCTKGSYQATTAAEATCTTCPTGLTTSLSDAATAATDCDLCVAGYGSYASGACTQCAIDTYSTGATTAACVQCSTVTKPVGYTGDLVSRPGATSSTQCVREFSSDRDTTATNLPWNFLATGAGVLSYDDTANATMTACQDKCEGNNQCVYFEFRSTTPQTCGLLLTKAAVASKPNITVTDQWLVLDIGDGHFTVNQMASADKANIGTVLSDAYGTFAAALAACKTDAACAGLNQVNDTNWRTFRGTVWGNTVGKLRAFGYNIDAWLP